MKKSGNIFIFMECILMKSIGKYENISRGTIEFPVEYYNLSESCVNYIMKYHWHMDWEFIRINKGKLILTLNENSMIVKEGDVVIIPGGILHGAEPYECEYECIVMHSSVIFNSGIFAKNIIRKNIKSALILNRADYKVLCEYADLFFDSLKIRNNGYEITAIGSVNLLLGKIIEKSLQGVSGTEKEISNKRIDNIKEALRVIENEFSSDISLERLAKSCGMSSRYFCEFFKEMTGHTPIDYLNRFRIETACKLLTVSRMNVTETALSCGFNDISYFIKIFKKYS